MCGIAGELTLSGKKPNTNWDQLLSLMSRRGPDDEGIWNTDEYCTLGFRRLAILDLSDHGRQPMVTSDGRYALVYNGEIYNFQDLRHQLELLGVRFRSTGDTEVVLYSMALWGIDALQRFNGMFALGFYDTHEKVLILARDHAGIKPLYYLHNSHGVFFASQYDQMVSHPWSRGLTVNEDALSLYLRLGYIPAPYALLNDTYAVEPGQWLRFQKDGYQTCGYHFQFPTNVEQFISGDEAYEATDAAITNAVQRQLISDVPVGTFLSGGIDSPLVTAKAHQLSNGNIKAFTIGTHGDELDESVYAERYAKQLGVEHYIRHVSSNEALDLIDAVMSAQTEPFGDYSIIPTLIISQLAREHVTVILSGDGGDELFWGYSTRFSSVIKNSHHFSQAHAIRTLRWGLKKYLNIGSVDWRIRIPTIGEWYRYKHSHLPDHVIVMLFNNSLPWPHSSGLFHYQGYNRDETANWTRWNEYTVHLPRVLLKVDRASMFHSLEVRVPLLDKEVIKTAARIDWSTCLDTSENIGKIPLRRSLSKHYTTQTTEKMGFSIPIDQWLKGPLKTYIQDELYHRDSLLGMSFDSAGFRELYQSYLSGRTRIGWGIWIILSLILWTKRHQIHSP